LRIIRNKKIIIQLIIVGSICFWLSCDSIKGKIESVSDSVKTKIQDKIVSALELDKIESRPMSFKDFFKPKGDELNIEHIDGVWFDLPMAFHYCFLKYKTDKDGALNYISNLNPQYSDISDSTYMHCDSSFVFEKLTSFYESFPAESNKISFFDELKNASNLEFYKCAKYPNRHLFAYDANEEIMYHFFERYWD